MRDEGVYRLLVAGGQEEGRTIRDVVAVAVSVGYHHHADVAEVGCRRRRRYDVWSARGKHPACAEGYRPLLRARPVFEGVVSERNRVSEAVCHHPGVFEVVAGTPYGAEEYHHLRPYVAWERAIDDEAEEPREAQAQGVVEQDFDSDLPDLCLYFDEAAIRPVRLLPPSDHDHPALPAVALAGHGHRSPYRAFGVVATLDPSLPFLRLRRSLHGHRGVDGLVLARPNPLEGGTVSRPEIPLYQYTANYLI